jgi:hypothetical protein
LVRAECNNHTAYTEDEILSIRGLSKPIHRACSTSLKARRAATNVERLTNVRRLPEGKTESD